MKYKSLVRAAVFLMIIAVVLFTVNMSLRPKYYLSNSVWPTTSTYQAFYEMDRNSIDVLFLGSSYCVNGFSPMEIYNSYGIRSYNLGSEQQSVFLSYYWLKEALRFQKPSVVILEGRFLPARHTENAINTVEGLIRKCLDPMKWSSVKLEAVKDLCATDKTQNIESWFFTNIRFHDRWKSLGEIDFATDTDITHSQLMGWAPGNRGKLKSFTPLVPSDENQTYNLDPLMVQYCIKMVNLCKENGIRFVIVNVPANTNAKINYAIAKLATENGIDYIEMADENTWPELGVNLSTENPVGHGNIWGNVKTSQYIGKVLSEKYGVPSVVDSQYEDKKGFYEHIKNSYRLASVTDIDEYLSLLQGDDYFYIYIAVSGEAVKGMQATTKELLKGLGLRHKWNKKTEVRKSYIAVKNDEGIIEKSGGRIEVSGQARDKRDSYSVISSGYKDEGGSYASIIFNGKEYSKNRRGLNIVVYDVAKLAVVDSVNFDTHAESEARR